MLATDFIALARAQKGKPYVLGWEVKLNDPNPEKFDCSELVQWLFAQAGCTITDLAASQYDVTTPVTTPKVGDLVFLKNNPARWNGIGHVAVITQPLANGDWEIVEAKGRNYGVVRSTLSFWKTRKYYAGIRRYLKLDLEYSQPRPYFFRPLSLNGKFNSDLVTAIQYWCGTSTTGLWDIRSKKALQKNLRFTGSDVDGIIGPKTVKRLQKLVGVATAFQDGIWGPETTRYVKSYLNKTLGVNSL